MAKNRMTDFFFFVWTNNEVELLLKVTRLQG